MISILIPVYNTSVVDLVRSLAAQCGGLNLAFEIICLDDHSQAVWRAENRVLAALEAVSYLELEENIGRARIRNRLTDLARYEFLLFMDGDSRMIRPDYIRTYLNVLKPEVVIYGGRVYREDPPAENKYLLHWHYGRQRESLPARKRREQVYQSFMTNNFLIPASLARRVRFDETLRGYGYEDTLYALELKKIGVQIMHIDNPLLHAGLEERPVFLRKVGEALDNLGRILPQHPEINTRLLELVRQLNSQGVLQWVRWSAFVWMPAVKRFLFTFPKSPLWLLDLYKLGYFLTVNDSTHLARRN